MPHNGLAMHSNFNDLNNETMTAKEFLEENGIPNMPTQLIRDEQTLISDTSEALEAYHQAKLKLLGIAVVIERFSIGQPVKWEGMKFWVAEDNGDSKVLVCNCEDTKDIQQPEYNDWWVDRDVLNAL
jgi:hypothetical protein